MTKMAPKWPKLIDTLFMTKTAEKTLPFGAAHTYKGVPPPPLGAMTDTQQCILY